MDAMTLVHLLKIPKDVTTCAVYAEQYIRLVESVIHQFDEGHLIFDRYDIADSMNEATRENNGQQV